MDGTTLGLIAFVLFATAIFITQLRTIRSLRRQNEMLSMEFDARTWETIAWYEGTDTAFAALCEQLTRILDGQEPYGVSQEPWETVRRRVWGFVLYKKHRTARLVPTVMHD